MRVWFNKTFSSVHSALCLIRKADADGRYELVASSPNPHALVKTATHQFFDEPSKVAGGDYINWCENFCFRHGIDIFIPGNPAKSAMTYSRKTIRSRSNCSFLLFHGFHMMFEPTFPQGNSDCITGWKQIARGNYYR